MSSVPFYQKLNQNVVHDLIFNRRLTDIFTTRRGGGDSVGPTFDTIPEGQIIIELADYFSTLVFNSPDGAVARSRSDDIQR